MRCRRGRLTLPHGWSLAIVLLACQGLAGCTHVQPGARQTPQPEYVAPDIYTPPEVVDAMLTLAQVTADDIVFDLGSGDGRIVIAAARTFGASGVGVDIDGAQVRRARDNAAASGVEDRVRFIQADLFSVDFSSATVVTLYLGPKANLRLAPILEAQLASGTRVVSHQFDIPGWYADKRLMLRDARGFEREVFVWTLGRHRTPPTTVD